MPTPPHYVPMFVPYPFRPFWQPNSRASSSTADIMQLEKLTQKLDTAEKKLNEYAQLIASLYADIRISFAIAAERTYIVPQPLRPLHLGCLSLPPNPSVLHQFQLILLLSILSKIQSRSIIILHRVSRWRLNHLCKVLLWLMINHPQSFQWLIPDILQTTVASPPSTTTVTASHSTDADSGLPQPAVPSTPEKSTNVDPTQPDWSVEYNPESEHTLNLHVANTFTFTENVLCVKFSRDGNYLAVGLLNGEIHIHNMMTGLKSILVERSATVFYTEEAGSPSEIWALRFSLDNKYIATGGSNGQININRLLS